jgi:gag-polypeptide of LTR copia-type
MTEGSSLDTHMVRMTSDVEQLEKLNSPLSKEFVTDVILNSLPPSYSNFIRNYYMLGMDKSLQELQGMLRITDGEMKKSSSILVIQEGTRKIKKMKRKMTPKVAPKYKDKGKMVPNQNTPKAKVSSTSDCFYYQSKGHWKRNCPKYLEM